MSTTNSITTSFPLGLFCTATLSGPLPKTKASSARSASYFADRKIQNAHHLEVDREGLQKDIRWDDRSV
jgi:hypothetical protein